MNTKDFARNILHLEPETLKKRMIFIKFIVASGKVIFDPLLFVNFEKNFGEESMYHHDIAGAHGIDLGKVQGGAFAGIGDDMIRITGFSTQFGGIEGLEDLVKRYFESYFDCKVVLDI